MRGDFAFDFGDFLKTSGVSSGLEGGNKKDADDLIGELVAELVSGEADDVGVVVSAAVFCGHAVVAGGCADAGEFIGGDAHTDTCAADEDTAVKFAIGDIASDLSGVVRIVDALRFEGTKILHFALHALNKLGDAGFEGNATVIAGNANLHGSFESFLSRSGSQSRRFSAIWTAH